jgi:hypothetical protein
VTDLLYSDVFSMRQRLNLDQMASGPQIKRRRVNESEHRVIETP